MAKDIIIEDEKNFLSPQVCDDCENILNVSTKKNTVGIHNADGITPHIGENGNWWIGTIDTGVHAQGEQGIQGEQGKSAYEQAVEGGFIGTEQEFTDALNGNVKGIEALLNAYDENIAMQLQTIIG